MESDRTVSTAANYKQGSALWLAELCDHLIGGEYIATRFVWGIRPQLILVSPAKLKITLNSTVSNYLSKLKQRYT